ncbi:MAG: Rieske (2Fe-2S) protein [Nitrososphaerota archaeon]|nr:Rieske (2Fe-2S) protein [Nitrososphaerota archaeon]
MVTTALFGALGAVAIFEAVAKLGQSQPVPVLTPGATTGGQATTGQQAPAGYFIVAPLSALSGKASAYFNHPTRGLSILVDYGGQWRAFSALCTHAGCTVDFTGSQIYCPCHGGSFSPTSGAVLGGPPQTPLPEYSVQIQGGSLYVSG